MRSEPADRIEVGRTKPWLDGTDPKAAISKASARILHFRGFSEPLPPRPSLFEPDHDVPTFAQALDLIDDPDRIAEYERYHVAVWPEVVRGLRAIGVQRMRIWRTGTRLFMIYEAPDGFDPARDYQTYAEDPRCRAWDELMRTYQQRVPAANPDDGGWWTPMDLVFDLETQSDEPAS